jgi:transglutaminase-like putative cysteine protease
MKMAIPQNLRTTVTLAAIPDGVAGIRATLALMVKLAQLSKSSFAVRSRALSLVRALPQKDYFSEVKAIHEFVRDSIRYVKDIEGVETLASPDKTLLMQQGDCDDKALLAAALLLSVGHPVRFVAVGDSPNNFIHVLIETKVALKWWPVETTEPVAVGWYPQGLPYRLVYNIP